jgi:CheY-like chemotaxis protein
MADDATDQDDGERSAEVRHFVRNRLAAIRNAAFYLQRRTEPTPLWREDPRVPRFFALIMDELAQIETTLSRGPRAPTPPAAPPASQPAGRVLLVDDHDGNRETLAALLADEGFVVEQAASFAVAVASLESDATFDFVLLDRKLGEHDGLDLVPLVRVSRPSAKIVVVSGSNVGPSVGVDDVVGKDLGFEVLLEHLRELSVAR